MPKNWEQWNGKRTLKADRIVWLLTEPKVARFLSYRGLRITGAKIEDKLDLEYATVSVPLIFDACVFTEELVLEKSKLRGLQLNGTHVHKGINAFEIQVEDSVELSKGFVSQGGVVNLIGASIGGTLDCSNGQFINPGKIAISADGAKITDSVFLCNGFQAEGEVSFLGASIGGSSTVVMVSSSIRVK